MESPPSLISSNKVNQYRNAKNFVAPQFENIPSRENSQAKTVIRTIADTGCTDLLIRFDDMPCDNRIDSTQPFKVKLPNGNFIESIGHTIIKIPHSTVTLKAHVFDNNTLGTSLLSISELASQGCTTVFDNTSVTVKDKHGRTILQGAKEPSARLWCIPLPTGQAPTLPVHPAANLAIHNTTHAEYVKFTHATFGSPPTSTLYKAAKNGWLSNFPRITAKMISMNDPNAMATAIGHLDRVRQRQYSTKPSHAPPQASIPITETSVRPTDTSDNDREDNDAVEEDEFFDVYTKLVAASDINHSDLTGRFPTTSRRGNQYLLVSVWNGYVHMEPQASRTDAEYLKSYKATIEFFRKRGNSNIRIQRLDNETSQLLDRYLRETVEHVQYLPPANHRANKAERAIRDSKNHIISILATTHPSFPTAQWDELIEQGELTLNHLRAYRPDPTICAYEGLHRAKFYFLAHPLARLGTGVLVLEAPDKRKTWDPHGVAGFYIGPALDHHRAFRTFITATQRIRISDTLAWFPEHYLMPGASPVELLQAAINDLTTAVSTLVNTAPELRQSATLLEQATTATDALHQIAALYTPQPPREATSTRPIVQPPQVPVRELEPSPSRPQAIEAEQRVPEQRVPEQRVLTDNSGQSSHRTPHTTPAPVLNPQQPPTEATVGPLIVAPTIDNAHWVRRSVRLNQPATALATQAIADTPNSTYDTRAAARPPTVPLPPMNAHSFPTPAPRRKYRQNRHRNRQVNYCNPWLAGKTGWANNITATMDAPILNLDTAGNPLTFAKAVQGPDAQHWRNAEIDEFIRLIEVTETMHAIMPEDQPVERRKDTTYYNPQCKEKIKDGVKTYRVRGTAGGDRINYPGEVSARTAEMDVVKILLQSTVSDHANWMTADIKDFYLMTPLERPEYIRIPLRQLPQTIIDKYSLQRYIHKDSVLFQVNKGMYG